MCLIGDDLMFICVSGILSFFVVNIDSLVWIFCFILICGMVRIVLFFEVILI